MSHEEKIQAVQDEISKIVEGDYSSIESVSWVGMICEWIRFECIAIITRISCLLVYYDFELTPLNDLEFQNSKELYYRGDNLDLITAFCTLDEIEQTLLTDIWNFYKPHWIENQVISIWN